ncbi:MAG: hypothetical protein SGI88_03245 [Candidatus Hydrogenedentes bacterium]|nr:hypothetical protein [Candidatus Hydrogenedentota bacterium]
MRKLAAIVVAVLISFACTTLAQKRADTIRAENRSEEVLYFPNERLLDSFTCGHSSVVADILWLKCIQYTSQQFHGDFKFTLLDRMLNTITRLDPHYVDVYRWGSVFLAMLKRDNDASINLLKRGIEHNPGRWELPFEIARTYVLNRHDEVMGAKWMAVAAATGEPPKFVIDWAKNLQQRHGLAEVERGMWQEILQNSGDANMREVAQRKIIEIDLRILCEVMNEAAERYEAAKGSRPARIADLISESLISGMPMDPLGGEFFINSKGMIQNTSLLDSILGERRIVLQGFIKKFRDKHGRWPASLDELKSEYSAIPTNPYIDREWQYDVSKGEVL